MSNLKHYQMADTHNLLNCFLILSIKLEVSPNYLNFKFHIGIEHSLHPKTIQTGLFRQKRGFQM
jgi:hypothetical protein